jgi:hypothetical protein
MGLGRPDLTYKTLVPLKLAVFQWEHSNMCLTSYYLAPACFF